MHALTCIIHSPAKQLSLLMLLVDVYIVHVVNQQISLNRITVISYSNCMIKSLVRELYFQCKRLISTSERVGRLRAATHSIHHPERIWLVSLKLLTITHFKSPIHDDSCICQAHRLDLKCHQSDRGYVYS